MPYQICRICFKRGNDLFHLRIYERKLASCIPEIDVYMINDPGICKRCAVMLDTAFELRNLCFENEKRYNSMCKERDKGSCSKESSESAALGVDENTDSENLLEVMSESSILCSICNEEFSSIHDKKLHDFKMHRPLQHRKLKSLLTPIQNSNEALSRRQNITDYALASSSSEENTSIPNINVNDSAGVVTCSECCMTFVDNNELESHKTVHLRRLCFICKKTFNGEKELKDHVNLDEVRCCGDSFPTVSSLQLHTYKHHNKTCGICNENFKQYGVLFNHLLDHTKCSGGDMLHSPWEPDGESVVQRMAVKSTANSGVKYTKYRCRRCHTGYKNRSLLTKHLYKHHVFGRAIGFRDKSLECCLCGRQFELHIHLKMHILQSHCKKIPTVPIVDCRKDTFYREQEGLRINFIVPLEDVNATSEVSLLRRKFIRRSKSICFMCRVMFKKPSLLYYHGRKEHYSCCNKYMTSMTLYFQHNLTHYNPAEKDGVHENIMCMTCKMNYRNYAFLLAHDCKRSTKGKQQREATDQGLANSRCTIEDHERYSSDESETRTRECGESNSNKSCCEICKKEFDSKSRLMDHIKTHI